MKKELDGELSFVVLCLFFGLFASTPFGLSCLLFCVVARKNHEAEVSSLKEVVRTERNHAKEIITRSKEEMAAARLIRHGADHDLL